MNTEDIGKAARSQMGRIVLFALYYLTLGIAGAVIIAAAGFVSYLLVKVALPKAFHESVFGTIIVGTVIVGLTLLAIMLGIYLVRPLFMFYHDKKAGRVEIDRPSCPELFDVIDSLTEEVNCRKPKHVYICDEVNARVFYNTSFWSIFFPSGKNLEIGIPLLDGLSTEEFKAVLAHEFGHFSQDSMKLTESVYVANTVLANLIMTDDRWEAFMQSWCSVDIGFIRPFGVITYRMTSLVRKLTMHIYKYVQKGYFHLSKLMEYEADMVACRCVGSGAFISSICKIDVLAREDRHYRETLVAMLGERLLPENVFSSKKIFYRLIDSEDMPNLSYDRPLAAPVQSYDNMTTVSADSIWDSHPSRENRICNAVEAGYPAKPSAIMPAWALIPAKTAEKYSDLLLRCYATGFSGISYINDTDFEAFANKHISGVLVDRRMRPFFSPDPVHTFDMENIESTPESSPFTSENAGIIRRYAFLANDFFSLMRLDKSSVESKKVRYAGKIYSTDRLPLEECRRDMEAAGELARKLNSEIFAFVLSRCDQTRAQEFRDSFALMLRTQKFLREEIFRLISTKNDVLAYLSRDEMAENEIASEICSMESTVSKAVKSMDFSSAVEQNPSLKATVDYLKEYSQIAHTIIGRYDAGKFMELCNILEILPELFDTVRVIARKKASDIAAAVCGD